jgi:hypothetical protein
MTLYSVSVQANLPAGYAGTKAGEQHDGNFCRRVHKKYGCVHKYLPTILSNPSPQG